jgi:hypothetical protein
VREIVLKDTFRNAKVVQSECSPTIVVLSHTRDGVHIYTSYKRGELAVAKFDPGFEVPYFNRIGNMIPVDSEKVQKHLSGCDGIQGRTCVEAGDKATILDIF